MRNQKPENVPCSIEDGHISSALCHMGNISHRVGKLVGPEEISENVRNNSLQDETWQRMAEHLSKNNIELETDKLTLGTTLTIDSDREIFTGKNAKKANALLKDEYRKEWKMPELGQSFFDWIWPF